MAAIIKFALRREKKWSKLLLKIGHFVFSRAELSIYDNTWCVCVYFIIFLHHSFLKKKNSATKFLHVKLICNSIFFLSEKKKIRSIFLVKINSHEFSLDFILRFSTSCRKKERLLNQRILQTWILKKNCYKNFIIIFEIEIKLYGF